MKQSIFIELQQGLFSFNKNIHLTSRSIFVQEEYPFNFNAQSHVLWNEHIHSTSTQIIFIQVQQRNIEPFTSSHSTKSPPPDPRVIRTWWPKILVERNSLKWFESV